MVGGPAVNISYLFTPGHLVALDEHHCRFGRTWRPVCVEDGCGYVGPLVPKARARDIADEHTSKTAGGRKRSVK